MGQDTDRIRRDVSLSAMAANFGLKLVKDGAEFLACCPFHSEKTESFSIFTGSDGMERFYCFGCGERGDVLDFVQGVKGCNLPEAIAIIDGKASRQNVKPRAVEVRDVYAGLKAVYPTEELEAGKRVRLFNPKRRGDRTEWGGFAPSAVYPYRNETGRVIGYVLRHDLPDGGKETPMVMMVRDGDNAPFWSRFPFPKPRSLYGVGRELSKQVIVVEGEKCKDRLEAASFRHCVTWAGGTQGVKHSNWSPLDGHDLLVWPDNDAPGFATAREIAAEREGKAARVRFVDITRHPDYATFPKGWDAADLIDSGVGKEGVDAFLRLCVSDTLPEFPAPVLTAPVEQAPETAVEEKEAPAAVEHQEEASALAADSPDPDADLAPAKVKREKSIGLQGIRENLPAYFGSLQFGSEVEMSGALAHYLQGAAGGPVVKCEGDFWAYGPTCWNAIEPDKLRHYCHRFDGVPSGEKLTPLKVGKRTIDGVIFELGTILSRPDFFKDVPEAVNVNNGTVVIDERGDIVLREHSPDDAIRFTLNAEFSDDTPLAPPEGSLLHKLVTGAFLGDPDAADKIDLLGEIIGAAVFGMATRVKAPKAFVFLGHMANNGKSTIADLIQRMLPEGSVSAIAPAYLKDPTRVINLAGKVANVANEISASGISGEEFKNAITGEPMEGRDVYKPAFTFRPRALHVYTANKLPSFTGGLDRGLQRRLVVLRFDRTIPPDEVIVGIAPMIAKQEMGYLLGFAIAGAQRLKRNGGYTIPRSSTAELREWMNVDPMNEWFEARTKAVNSEPFNGWPRTAMLYADFKEWAKDEGHKESFLPAVNTFAGRLATIPGVMTKRTAAGRVAVGIDLKGRKNDLSDVF